MPPLPKTKQKDAAPKGGTEHRVPRGLLSDLSDLGIDSPGGGIPRTDSPPRESPPRERFDKTKNTPKDDKLEEKIARFYKMIGAIVKPFKRWFPPAQLVGDSFKSFADEAAEAWMEVAKDDPRIRKYLVEFTSVSAWGNLIGVHVSMFEKTMVNTMQEKGIEIPQTQDVGDILKVAKDMGISDADLDATLKQFGLNINGPGDTIRTGGPTVPPMDNVREKEGAAIASPDQLGISNDGQLQESQPLRTGGIN